MCDRDASPAALWGASWAVLLSAWAVGARCVHRGPARGPPKLGRGPAAVPPHRECLSPPCGPSASPSLHPRCSPASAPLADACLLQGPGRGRGGAATPAGHIAWGAFPVSAALNPGSPTDSLTTTKEIGELGQGRERRTKDEGREGSPATQTVPVSASYGNTAPSRGAAFPPCPTVSPPKGPHRPAPRR